MSFLPMSMLDAFKLDLICYINIFYLLYVVYSSFSIVIVLKINLILPPSHETRRLRFSIFSYERRRVMVF
jgi:hypothetical protein